MLLATYIRANITSTGVLYPKTEARGRRRCTKAFYELALQIPGVVAWYCTLKLEMAVRLAQEIITPMLQSDIVPGRHEATAILRAELQRLGLEVSFDYLPDLRNYGCAIYLYASLE